MNFSPYLNWKYVEMILSRCCLIEEIQDFFLKADKSPYASFDLLYHNQKLIARVGRDAIPMNLAMGFFILRNHHHIYCKGWSGGCQASAYEKVN